MRAGGAVRVPSPLFVVGKPWLAVLHVQETQQQPGKLLRCYAASPGTTNTAGKVFSGIAATSFGRYTLGEICKWFDRLGVFTYRSFTWRGKRGKTQGFRDFFPWEA
jgi:hypothetical protein